MPCGYSKYTKAHRFSWEYHNEEKIPLGKKVCHKCDNPECTNPAHLFLGTPQQNTDDMIQKGRKPIGSQIRSSVIDEKDVRIIKNLVWLDVSQSIIASAYGVSVGTINNIKRGISWKHVE